MLWNVETKYINIDWNVHQPLRLPDWDDDGVAELLVAHGGEYKYGPEVKHQNKSWGVSLRVIVNRFWTHSKGGMKGGVFLQLLLCGYTQD